MKGPTRGAGASGRRVAGFGLMGTCLAILLVSTAVACGEQRGPATLEEARALLRSEIDTVAGGALGHLRWRPEGSVTPATCEGAGGVPLPGESTVGYGLEAEFPASGPGREALRAVAAEWRRRGYHLIAVHPSIVHAERDGMLFEFVVTPELDRVFLGGSTPCLPFRRDG